MFIYSIYVEFRSDRYEELSIVPKMTSWQKQPSATRKSRQKTKPRRRRTTEDVRRVKMIAGKSLWNVRRKDVERRSPQQQIRTGKRNRAWRHDDVSLRARRLRSTSTVVLGRGDIETPETPSGVNSDRRRRPRRSRQTHGRPHDYAVGIRLWIVTRL